MKKVKGKYTRITTNIILFIFAVFIIQACSAASYSSDDIKMEKIENSPQFDDGEFKNLTNVPVTGGFFEMFPVMWDFMFGGTDTTPDVDLPVKQVNIEEITNAKNDELKVTWLGHSSIIINIDGKIIVTDPIFENSTAFMGPSRYNGDIPTSIEALPEIDIVLISHNHYDHLNSWTIEQLAPKVKKFIVPLMVGAQLEDLGVPREKIIELDWWDETEIDDFLLALTPAQHYSGRGLGDRFETLWGSFVIKGKYHNIYYSGDSGYFDSFKKIGNKYGPFDLTLIECGAYNEKWKYIHMMPEETAQAHLNLKGEKLIPIHWATFDLAMHPWYDPSERVSKAADSLGINLLTPIVGETITITDSLTTERWWKEYIPKSEEVKATGLTIKD